MTKEALIKWYDSGAENRDEFITLVEQALAQQEQPAQKPVAWLHGTTFQVVVSKNRPESLSAWLPLFAAPPTQPALSESQITSIAYNCNALPEVITDKTLVDFVRAIEAHCRGGQA